MRILVVHNRYREPGGEDVVVHHESALLKSQGHTVEFLTQDNEGIVTLPEKVKTALRCTYSRPAYQRAAKHIREFRPDVVHVHNFFPRLSPAVHYAAHRRGIPVVQTLHNFRLLCPGATFHRKGMFCDACAGKNFAWPAIWNRCYRNSIGGTGTVATMNAVHRILRTWHRTVSVFIALTESSRDRYIASGFPAAKIVVKPQFTSTDPGLGSGAGRFALYVGRLSPEKGIANLLEAWGRIGHRRVLKIVGDGPLGSQVQLASRSTPGIEWLGSQPHPAVLQLMRDAELLIVPSVSADMFPLVIVEAFSAGLPVIGSRIGAMAEVVTEGRTGRLFSPGDSLALAAEIDWAFTHPGELNSMRLRARREYESRYTEKANYRLLMDIYERAIAGSTSECLSHV